MATTIPQVALDNGVQMPILGFGVFQIPAEQTEQAVTDAPSARSRPRCDGSASTTSTCT